MRRMLRLAVSCALASVLLAAGTQFAGSANAADVSAAIRHATVRFHSVQQASRAGYVDPGLPCFDDPSTGSGMGTHLVRPDLIGDHGALDPLRPEGLVYEVRSGSVKLVAVEYIVPFSASATAPTLFGQSFAPNEALQLWTLHAWVWRSNPVGLFEAYNANVNMCPR
jgi:hypothetical protein